METVFFNDTELDVIGSILETSFGVLTLDNAEEELVSRFIEALDSATCIVRVAD